MRYKIIKPIDCEWKLLGKVLRDIQYDTRHILNKTIQYFWEWQGFSSDYKEQFGLSIKANDISNYKSFTGYVNNKLKTQYNRLYSGNLSTTIGVAEKRWKNDAKEILLGNKSIPNYKRDVPIDLHNKAFSIIKEDNNYLARIALISTEYKEELGRAGCSFNVLLNEGDKSSKDILNRCISGEYKISASKILNKGNEWLLNLAYSFEPQHHKNDKSLILGVDMGIVYPIYMAVGGTLIRGKIEGGELKRFRQQIEKRTKELQKQGKYCSTGRIGHGIKTRIKPIEFAKDKVANFRDTLNHNYSKYVVEFAYKNNCGIIQMENLSGIKDKSILDQKMLKNWTYYDLQQKIIYKAEEKGIEVRLIEPQFTSQRCSKCGHIEKENRPSQEKFLCKKCCFEINADYNAALNIATLDIENLIKETIKCEI